MYGTIARITPKPGQESAVIALMEEWDRESYRANSEDPKQDEWYRKIRDLLQADPVWEDGEILYGRAW